MVAFLKLIRLPNLLIIAFTQYMVRWFLIYPILHFRGLELQMNNFSFFLLSLSTVMIASAGYIINDYFDTKIDRINKPEKMLIDSKIKRREAMGAHIIINILGIGIGIVLCYLAGIWKLGIVFLICAMGLWFYSTNLKRTFLIGNFLIALFTSFVPLIAGAIEIWLDYVRYSTREIPVSFNDIRNWLLGISFFAFIITLIREIIKDMEDLEGDSSFGCRTLPIVLGITKAKVVVIALMTLTILLILYLQVLQYSAKDTSSFFYFLGLIQFPMIFSIFKLFIAKEKKDFHFVSTMIKGIMISGICYLFLFAYLLIGNI